MKPKTNFKKELLHNLNKYTLWNLPNQSRKIHVYGELESTMDTASEFARADSEAGTVVVALRQTKGRGRMDRVWHSEDGGLYFTIILRPDIPLSQAAMVSFAASLAMVEALNRLFHVEAKVKWPNDLLVKESKIAGMLSQLEIVDNKILFLNIGIGLNVNNEPAKFVPGTTSLKSILKRPVSRKEILANFLSALDTRLNSAEAIENIVNQWKKRAVTLGRMVKIVTTTNTFSGLARDLDSSGALILECDDGTLKTISYGDCFHQ